jgi:hypothetical protein
MIEVTSPNPDLQPGISVFAAGSIEQGKAEHWQVKLKEELKDEPDVVVYNPRRLEWNSGWVQSIDNPEFKRQVNWELDRIELADIVFFYIDPNTASIITMAEWGHVYKSGRVVITCPKGYFRRGNIEVMADRAGIRVNETFDEGIAELKDRIERKRNQMQAETPLPSNWDGRDMA